MAKQSIKKRKCSLCKKVGHDRRTCPSLTENTSTKKIVEKITKKSPVVLVQVAKAHRRSPHVVDLKQELPKDIWKDVKAFKEEVVGKERWAELDFGGMVKRANQTPVVKQKNKKQRVVRKNISKEIGQKLKINLTKVKQNFFDNYQSAVSGLKSAIPSLNYQKLAYSSIALFLLVAIPFPAIGYYNDIKDTSARVVESSTNAFLSLQSSTVAAISANVDQAQYDLNSALNSFGEANDIVEKEYKVLQFVAGLLPVVGKQVTSRQHLLQAGHHLALGNTYLVKGVREAEKNDELALTDRFNILANHLRSSLPQYREALEDMSAVDSSVVPVEYQQSFNDFKFLFATMIDDMQDLVDLSQSIELIFGGEQFKRYLLVFQNNHELRPTGGFMGSFAIMDVQKGKIMNLDVPGGGTYDLQGQLKEFVEPPLPLQLSNGRWEFQDANWFPDFPASAQKMAWFYENARGVTVDGVIAINATVLERLLAVVGPLSSEEHGLEIAGEDALSDLQYEVEMDYDKEINKPKEVLGDLAGDFLSQLEGLSAVNVVQLLAGLHEALEQKEIQVYFNDEYVQSKMKTFAWTGDILEESDNQDYLQVVNTNIQGQKSDARIKQTIEHQAIVGEDGFVVDTVIITREHVGFPGEMFYGVNNVDYLRVYVPEGAELVDAGGFVYPPEDAFRVPETWYAEDEDLKNNEVEIGVHAGTGTRVTQEFGKTAFGNWSMVAPGETTQIYFTYKLPFQVLGAEENYKGVDRWREFLDNTQKQTSRYSLLIQKQSGINSEFVSQVIYPDNWSPVWQENDSLELATNGAEFKTLLETDEIFGVVMEKK